jgi:broad specificity phosphatase PhoE
VGRVILVRHGQASFGAADYDHLSPLGVEQARLTGLALVARGLRAEVMVQGRMRRHAQTTDALLGAAGWSQMPVDTSPAWDEIDHLGVMRAFDESPEQSDPRAFQAAYERALRRWMTDPEAAAGETFRQFTTRVAEGLSSAAELAGPGRTVVVVSSAGPLAVACATLLHPAFPEVDPQAWLRWNTVAVNASLTTVVVGRQGTRLLAFNEHGHLAPEHITFR